LKLDAVSFAFGGPSVLSDVTFGVAPGRFFSLLGSSGSGKTTVLRLIGGYLTPTEGHIRINGPDVTGWPPERRDVGMVFQNYALFPHLSARENVAFGLEMRKVPRVERARRVEAMLDHVGLSAAERDRRPSRLSGGQQQRVALARALAIEPALLLLDEPFANLDRELREQLRGELRELQRRTGVTTILVTHDREEALQLADSVGVLAAGRLLQVGDPQTVYQRPCCPLVARLLGEANLFSVPSLVRAGLGLAAGLPLNPLSKDAGRETVGRVVLLRPETCSLVASGGGVNCWSGRVITNAFLGANHLVAVEVAEGVTVRVRLGSGTTPPSLGQMVHVLVPPEAVWILPENDPEGAAHVPS
jgi:ABC-type Fe3+/spermidine/putrescine transport system ATPase subunit